MGIFREIVREGCEEMGGKKEAETGSSEKHRFFTALSFPSIKKPCPLEDLQKGPHISLYPLPSQKVNFIDYIITFIIPHGHLFQNTLKSNATKVILRSFSTLLQTVNCNLNF